MTTTKPMHILPNFKADKSWTIFLDRDGVINRLRVDDYVKVWDEFVFEEGVLDAIAYFSSIFGRICIVTNQQGIGRGLMSEEDLSEIHSKMMTQIVKAGGRIDKIYHCPHLAKDFPDCRKPEIGMGLQAAKDFPEIDFSKSIMVGDSSKDMEFAQKLGMFRFYVNGRSDKFDSKLTFPEITNLSSLASYIKRSLNKR